MSDRNFAPERVRANFRMDLLSGVFAATMFSFVTPFMPVLVRRLGGSELEVSLVIAAVFIGHLLSPLGAYFLSPVPLVVTVAATSALGRAVFLAGAIASGAPLVLTLAYVGFWIFTLSNIAAYTGLMQRIYPDEQRATAMGRVRIVANLAGLVAATLGGFVLQIVAEPAKVLAAAAAISLLGTVSFLRIRHEEPAVRPRIASPPSLLPMVRADPTFARFLLSQTVLGFGTLIGATLYPLLLVDRFDAPNAFVGIYTATAAAATMASYHFWGSRIDRGSSIRLTLANSTLLLGMPLVYLIAPTTWALLPAAIFAGLAQGGGDLTFFTNLVQMAPKGKVADYMAAQSFALGVRGTIAPFVASALLLTTNATVVLTMVVIVVAAGLLLLRDVAGRVEARATADEIAAS